MKKYKILIDTDIGDDIDDAYALGLALKLPQVELVGITTCYKNTVARAKIAKYMLSAYGRKDVPVYAGACTSDAIPVQYAADMEDICPDGGDGTAVDFILSCAEKYGEKLVILAIGPLVNLADAVRKKPDALKNATVYCMGGNYYGGKFEWNVYCAACDAADVFAACPNLYAVGTDVTYRIRLDDGEREKIEAQIDTPPEACLARLTALWYAKNKRNVILHDPATLLALTDPQAFTFERQNIYVERQGRLKGLTVNLSLSAHFVPQTGASAIFCARDIDAARVKKAFLQTVFGGVFHE